MLRDEVALDFPSTRQALDHARRDFAEVEAPGVDLAVDVVLTPLEARRSKRVPLCLQLPCLCDACAGRGGTWNHPCATCAGEGTAPAPRYVVVRIPASSVDGARLTYRFVMPYGTPVRLEVRLGRFAPRRQGELQVRCDSVTLGNAPKRFRFTVAGRG